MSHPEQSHLDPERLSVLALGDPATGAEQIHLDNCDECAIELAELEYTVTVGRATVGLGDLEAPPERVWDRISDELGLGAGEAPSADPATVVADAPEAADLTPAPRRGRATRVLFTLAASVAVILVVIGVSNMLRPPQVVELASATLDAFPDHPGAAGAAVVVETDGGEKEVRVELDADEASDGYREVWLITADASALVSLGVLEGSEGTFPIPEGIDIRDYVLVDISQEPTDGDPAHSGDSIVRGELGFA
ncbi:anti-sigma factor [Microbacterium sp. 2FI]|uniref:anti-sigma factor n=1 Tax=Microbacterium sp. 2FI TaxID=2502193 RepID=UPI0010F4ECDD|nr:anti-sigma factor [Microbacterium sp. 2FI]